MILIALAISFSNLGPLTFTASVVVNVLALVMTAVAFGNEEISLQKIF